MKHFLLALLSTALLLSCSETSEEKNTVKQTENTNTLFSKITSNQSGIAFRNNLKHTDAFSYLNYEYIYNGAGVAVLDYDKDGLQDLYFVSNLETNKFYKNTGNFTFEDVTQASRTGDKDGFSTGVSVLDVNADGWPDLYVCKAGSLNNPEGRRNLLFVNQKDGSFKEEAKQWGLDHPGYSAQAYLFDYDRDGDRDLYLVNYRIDFENAGGSSDKLMAAVSDESSDQLFRNDGNKFENVTASLGLMNNAWGMSAVISDFNQDGWEDIYIANDFTEPDYMYINLGDGNFSNQTTSRLQHISYNSMGSDYADLNNDLLPDLMTLDMLSDNYARSKENMASMDTEFFRSLVRIGYHHAYMANMLHINKGYGIFEETGQLSGVTKTDWSWSTLLADFDNDGFKDIYVTNGVERDYNHQDTRNKVLDILGSGKPYDLQEILAMYPSEPITNHAYKNLGDLTFEKSMDTWGLADKTISNGAAYADLDNDGDLDLIVQNLNDNVGLYRNNATNNYLTINLKGPTQNPMAIGSKAFVTTSSKTQLNELYLARGFMSSVSNEMHFGLGDENTIDELIVLWPDGKTTKRNNIKANQKITVDYTSASTVATIPKNEAWTKQVISASALGIDYTHQENDFDDYTVQLLLPQKQSTKGTAIITGDLNGDGLDDFFVGNAAGSPAATYLQTSEGTFNKNNKSLWSKEAKYEDANALFFDADSDGDQDLYVVSAGYELSKTSPLLQDRLYINDGKGQFTPNTKSLPKMLVSGKSIAAADYDSDGDLDLFVGGNLTPKRYPEAPRSYLLNNEGGTFTDIWENDEALQSMGMVSDATFTDYDSDGDLDLLAVGEWMKPTFIENKDGTFEVSTSVSGLDDSEGWYYSINAADIDGDGDQDYIAGNLGLNNKFHPKQGKPLYIYAKDFDANGSFDIALSKINDGRIVPIRGKECSSEQNPFLLDKIKTYKEFATLDMNAIYGEDKLNDALKLQASMFESSYIENLGNGNFKINKLPNEAQKGPTMATIIKDFNGDSHLDIMGIGALYDAEVETIRYDGSFGYVLLGDGKGNFKASKSFDPIIVSDSKDLASITIQGKTHYMVVSNNAALEIFTFKP